MSHLNLHIIAFAVLLGLAANTAQAGLFRDRANSESEMMLEDETASGSVGLSSGVKLLKDIAYGEDDAQKMDVYLPAHAEHAPVILMVHGGGWRRGDKAMDNVVKNKVARWVSQGYVFISVNYRMLPKADPLAQADDVAHALAWAQAHAADWGADPDKFILMGHSAGAHLVALLDAAPERALKLGARTWLGAVVLDSAAVDVEKVMQRRHLRLYDKAFGKDPAFWKAASPAQVLNAEAKPMLLVCSTKRQDQPCEQAYALAVQAAALDVHAEVSEQALSHGEINKELGLPGDYTDTVERFMGELVAGRSSRNAE